MTQNLEVGMVVQWYRSATSEPAEVEVTDVQRRWTTLANGCVVDKNTGMERPKPHGDSGWCDAKAGERQVILATGERWLIDGQGRKVERLG